jgi:hypothetical protein
MTIKETPNIITAVLKVTATAEFFDDEASEETVRYVIEQCLEDAGFDVDVALLKEQEAVEPKFVGVNTWTCGECGAALGWEDFTQSGLELVEYKFCPGCGKAVKWNEVYR